MKEKDVLISFIAYMGNMPYQISLSQYFFGNVYISLEDYNKENSWKNIKQMMVEKINQANAATVGDSRYVYRENIAILNVLKN